MVTSLHAHYEETDQILGTASCSHVAESEGGGSSAADINVPAFEECKGGQNERELELEDQGYGRQVQRTNDFSVFCFGSLVWHFYHYGFLPQPSTYVQ